MDKIFLQFMAMNPTLFVQCTIYIYIYIYYRLSPQRHIEQFETLTSIIATLNDMAIEEHNIKVNLCFKNNS